MSGRSVEHPTKEFKESETAQRRSAHPHDRRLLACVLVRRRSQVLEKMDQYYSAVKRSYGRVCKVPISEFRLA